MAEIKTLQTYDSKIYSWIDISLTQKDFPGCTFAPVMLRRNFFFFVLAIVLVAAGCEKAEQPIKLPSAGNALSGRVDLGENYDKQVFYDFASNSIIQTSELSSWDLAFESGAYNHEIFMNGGKGITVLNTHNQSFDAVAGLPPGTTAASYSIDAPSGRADSTGIGEWTDMTGNSRGEVFIVQLEPGKLKKIKFISVDDQQYTIQYGDIYDHTGIMLTLKKNPDYNYQYFSFADGSVMPEPPKNKWDVVFTHYRSILLDNNGVHIPYLVTGALLNPYKTMAGVDSLTAFTSMTRDEALAIPASANRDAIGYDWKTYTTAGVYQVKSAKIFILHSRASRLFKLHFTDFYSATGVKGSPSFEFEEL